MNKLLSLVIAVALLLCGVTPALAERGMIERAIPDWREMSMFVSVKGGEPTGFVGSVDGSAEVELSARECPAEEIGHIIVIDLGYTWTKHITADTVRSVVHAYLSAIPQGQQVMFILVGEDETTNTNYMSVELAMGFVDGLLLPAQRADLLDKPSRLMTDNALTMAFSLTETSDAPMFTCVFAVVDLGNADAAASATALRENYLLSGNAFPVTVAAIVPREYIENSPRSEAAMTIQDNLMLYAQFAQDNGGSLIQLPCDSDGAVVPSTLSSMLSDNGYYEVKLTPLHGLIDYSKTSHDFVITPVFGKTAGVARIFSGIPGYSVPMPLMTPTPPVSHFPTPTPTPTPTPDPYMVHLGDDSERARQVIYRLHGLRYLDDMPSVYNNDCASAFVDFCVANGLPMEVNVSVEAYSLLMSDRAIPNGGAVVTPSPTPDPYMVRLGDESDAAIMVIRQLHKLHYLDEMTFRYDASCASAFVDFCADNGLKQEPNVSVEAFDLLMSGRAQPRRTATPSPRPEVTPVPVIYVGASNSRVARTIRLLEDMHYLKAGEKTVWDADCMTAFLQMCVDNEIPFPLYLDYIDEEWYEKIVQERIYPLTPLVTPTPGPLGAAHPLETCG